ncbi:MAG: acylphosphatase [Spirochaetaceae bacterium]|jgi:acylphosphatase|nr:acylphosphatase [Spirochaetaceae bacterium]
MHIIGGAAAPEAGVSAFFAQIQGRVQGVGFRYLAAQEARRLGLSGWVRNRSDGTVEVWSEGPADKQATFLAWLRRGPPSARVTSLRHESCSPTANYPDFSVQF